MPFNRLIGVMVASLTLFLLITAISYFALSDGYGLPGVEDGLTRVGFPFLFFERGGLAFRSEFSIIAFIGDVLAAFVLTVCVALALQYSAKMMNRPSKSPRDIAA